MNVNRRTGAVIKLIGVVTTLLIAGGAMGDDKSTWRDLPPLVLQTCINLDQKIEPIPVTQARNDFLVVTAYEEKTTRRDEIDENGAFLNLYLVGGLFMVSRSTGFYYNSQLVVDRLIYDVELATKTDHKWTIVDSNRDGIVDQAVFQTVVKDRQNNVLKVEATAVPEGELEALQSYYEEAINLVRQKRAAGTRGTCIPA